MNLRLALCLLTLAAAASARAQGEDSASDTAARAPRNAQATAKWLGFAAQGLAYGRGRPSDNGTHALDSLSLTGKQTQGSDLFMETLAGATDAKPVSGRFQEGEAGLTCKFGRNGFSASLNGGLNYTTALYDKRSRAAKVKGKAKLYRVYGGELKQKFVLDADSNQEWVSSAGYDDEGGQYRTWSFSSAVSDDLGDFDVGAGVDGFRENATEDAAPCAAKAGKACPTGSSTSVIKGIGLAADADWNPDEHLVALHLKFDWQSTRRLERIVTVGAGYTYSPWDWLDLGAGITHETNLDATKKPDYWQGTSVLECHF